MYPLIRSLLFRLDAEAAHEWTTEQMIALQEIPIALRIIHRLCRPPITAQRELFGLKFPSPIGIAAGFDKNALMIPMLAALGFGFIEVGTVTLKPQPGNPRPRLFRYPRERALINRMGFNNDGAEAIAERLRSAAALPPLFVNIGKNRDEDNWVPCYEKVVPYADAVVLNLSSPNTPGLRDFQRPEQMQRLLQSIPKRGPLLVKIAPDLDDSQIEEICAVCVKLADGMICTNTTTDRPRGMNEEGGLSGAPLMQKSTDVLRKVRECVGSAYPLIGVGGVFSPEDVQKKMIAGADLVQVYTSFIYEGPSLPRRLARAL
ncbi:MAG TPA: quinone-dependent dihydroorotate dehydrogenase [Thermoanaerobaculia bacterium]|jgi:dihydroorotate dehydrogenase